MDEQLQQEKSRKEQELKDSREKHQSQISSLQEKITHLVSIVGQSPKMILYVKITHQTSRFRNNFYRP